MAQRKISKAELDAINKRVEGADEALTHLMPERATETCTLSAMGGAYMLGELPLYPATLETMAMLQAVNSPFLRKPEDIENSDMEIKGLAPTVFVLSQPPDAIHAVMALAQRRQSVGKLEAMAKEGPEFFRVYLDKIDELACIEADFTANCIAVYASAGVTDLLQVVSAIQLVMADAMDGFSMLPEDSKKNTGDMT